MSRLYRHTCRRIPWGRGATITSQCTTPARRNLRTVGGRHARLTLTLTLTLTHAHPRSPTLLQTAATARQYGAVRPVPITIVTITSNQKKDPAVVYASEWLEKLARYTKVEQVTIKPNPLNAKDPEQAKAEESRRVLAAIQKSSGAYAVCLDERGEDATSESMADILEKASDSGATSLLFLLGGPFGHTKEVRDAADQTVRLSRCVLNHAVASVVLSEQLYRAWTIVRGEPYHH